MFTNVKISEEINDTFITLGWVEGFSKVRYKYQLEEKKTHANGKTVRRKTRNSQRKNEKDQ